jgi:predicted dehydrogenase
MSAKVTGKVRLAIIGAGGIAGAHIRGILANKDKMECIALCDISDSNLRVRSEQLGGVRAQYKDWRRMLSDFGENIDAVDICLPHHLHAAAILDAAAAKKHILCEKPMCTSLKDADRIAAAVKKAGVTYMSAHNQLFLPVVQEAKRLIAAGAIGRVRWLRSQDCFRADPLAFEGQWRSRVRTQGGGELIDTGYHPSYRLLYLAGAPAVSVRGSMARFALKMEGEDTACVQVRFANGAIGEILTSWAFALPHGTHQIHIIGEKGQIFGSNNELYLLPQGFAEPARMNLHPVETFAAEIVHFADCLRTGKRPIHSVDEGRAVLDLILKATEDAKGWQRAVTK